MFIGELLELGEATEGADGGAVGHLGRATILACSESRISKGVGRLTEMAMLMSPRSWDCQAFEVGRLHALPSGSANMFLDTSTYHSFWVARQARSGDIY